MTYLDELRDRLGFIIRTQCNTVGCDNCGLKWDTGCSATELQGKILDMEMEEFNELRASEK